MASESLEDLLRSAGNPVELLRHSQTGPYVYPVVPNEFSNWRDEQEAWQKTCVLFDQSYHMSELHLRGPDALRLLSNLGVNSFNGFEVNKAKQFVACNHAGHVIGDAILFYLDKEQFALVGRPSALNWVQYHCETGGYRATVERDERAAVRVGPIVRKSYRFQVQGPTAPKVLEKLNGGPLPQIKFFNMGETRISGRKVRCLRHGMVGQPGLEVFGPWEEGEAIKAAIVEAGREFGLKQAGSRTYSSNTLESGWIPSPLPAVYVGEQMKPYRQWLPAKGYEGTASLGGSFYSNDITDYYLTPYELGYGAIVKFDHDYVGRAALEKMAARTGRRKVTLILNGEDVARAIGSMFQKGDRAKYIDFPSAVYSTLPYDKVLKGDKTIGISTWCGYSSNERSMLSLAIVESEHSEPGTEVVLVWGEEGGGSSKPSVERHVQVQFRAIVGPVPYAEAARVSYRK